MNCNKIVTTENVFLLVLSLSCFIHLTTINLTEYLSNKFLLKVFIGAYYQTLNRKLDRQTYVLRYLLAMLTIFGCWILSSSMRAHSECLLRQAWCRAVFSCESRALTSARHSSNSSVTVPSDHFMIGKYVVASVGEMYAEKNVIELRNWLR